MSFNDLARIEAAKKKASQSKDPKGQPDPEPARPSGGKPVAPPAD